jgi:hypothetical protein
MTTIEEKSQSIPQRGIVVGYLYLAYLIKSLSAEQVMGSI